MLITIALPYPALMQEALEVLFIGAHSKEHTNNKDKAFVNSINNDTVNDSVFFRDLSELPNSYLCCIVFLYGNVLFLLQYTYTAYVHPGPRVGLRANAQ